MRWHALKQLWMTFCVPICSVSTSEQDIPLKNNRGSWNHPRVIQRIPVRHTRTCKARPQVTIESSHIGRCARISESTNVKYKTVFFWRSSPQWARASSFTRFLDHTQRHTTVGRTPLDEWSIRRRDLYLTHNSHNRQTSLPRRNIIHSVHCLFSWRYNPL
jgi:hypothetical protein